MLADSQKQRIIAMVYGAPPLARACPLDRRLMPEEAVKQGWWRGWAARPFGFCCFITCSSRGGKKMWCVAELKEAYISRMEEVLAALF